MESDFHEAVERAQSQWRRRVLGITFAPQEARISFRLGCGHEVTTRVADHPLESIENLYGVDLGDEFDCPFCAVQ